MSKDIKEDLKRIDIEAIKTFYDLLGHKAQTEIRAFELSPDFKKSVCKGQYFVNSQEEFVEICKKYNGRYNLYAGLNERKEKGTEARDVISIKNLFLDIDCKIKPASKEDLKEAVKVTDLIKADLLKEFEAKATEIYSGNGFQLLYSIPEITINDDSREEVHKHIEDFTKYLIKKYSNEKIKLDNVSDLPRIIRITGTINIKGNKISVFNEINHEENIKLKDYIMSFKEEEKIDSCSEIEQQQPKVKDESRSALEYRKVIALLREGKSREEIYNEMKAYSKWASSPEQYKTLTFEKAESFVLQEQSNLNPIEEDKPLEKKENPFNILHHATEHLPRYNEFSKLIGLYGNQYISILKCRWYQLHGGVLQKKINLGSLKTDTRIQVCYPLVTEGGKNEVIYSIKTLCEKGIRKNSSENFKCSEPISFHQEALIGKMVERLEDNPLGRGKPIKVRIENRGHLANDFVEFDECNQLITSNSPDMQQAREYLSKAENPIGRNKVEKRSVEDLETETISYYPYSTHSYYFQPFTKLPESFVLQGFGRRKFIPVGNISKFLTSANEKLYFDKLNPKGFSEEVYKSKLIEHLEKMRKIFDNDKVEFLFTEKAIELIQDYSLSITGQAELHSEKIYNFMKISKWTCLSNLVKMSCILAGSYYQKEVNEDFVSLAYMDLVELMQSTFDFIEERIIGDFSYGTTWEGADYNEIECLKYLYEREAFSFETSNTSINFFLEELIMPIFKVKGRQAENKYREMKKKKLIDSKQDGKNSSRVWINFNPIIQKNNLEGSKGRKGYTTYNSVFGGINSILSRLRPLQPLHPMMNEKQEKLAEED